MSDLTDDAVEALVRRFRDLAGRIAELKGEQDVIKATIDEGVGLGWKLSVDGVVAQKRPANRIFDMVTAVGLLAPEVKAACVTTSFDTKLVRTAVEELGLIDECMILPPDRPAVLKLL